MFIYSMFIEALILKAPDVKTLEKLIEKLYLQARSFKLYLSSIYRLYLQALFKLYLQALSFEIEKLQVYRKKAWQKTEVKEIGKV